MKNTVVDQQGEEVALRAQNPLVNSILVIVIAHLLLFALFVDTLFSQPSRIIFLLSISVFFFIS